jgi:hypothetical protein
VGKCHEIIRRTLLRVREGVVGLALNEAADDLYSRLLCPFTDIFCFFSADFGGFRPIVRHLASWLDKGQTSTKATYPRVLIVMKTTGTGIESEREAKNIILTALRQETTKDLAERFSALDVLALSSEGKCPPKPRYRRLEEWLIKTSDQMRLNRADTRSLLSARHFLAFFRHSCDHFARTVREPFDSVKTSRLQIPSL